MEALQILESGARCRSRATASTHARWRRARRGLFFYPIPLGFPPKKTALGAEPRARGSARREAGEPQPSAAAAKASSPRSHPDSASFAPHRADETSPGLPCPPDAAGAGAGAGASTVALPPLRPQPRAPRERRRAQSEPRPRHKGRLGAGAAGEGGERDVSATGCFSVPLEAFLKE